MGQGLGPGLTIVATRRSAIFSAEGAELVLTALGYASSESSSNSPAPSAPIEIFRMSRRFMNGFSFPRQVASRLMRDPNRFNTFHLESGLTLKGCGGDRTRTISPQKIASLTNPMRFETFRERPEKTHEQSRNHEFHPTSCDISHQCMFAIGISAVDRPRAID